MMTQITIMQFSDLHKGVSALDSSKTLVSSIVSDVDRYHKDDIPISKPDILVVCGDIIQGVHTPGFSGDFEKAIQEVEYQFKKANEFLVLTCNKLFDGKRERVIIVPGNHDVSWPHSQKSMEMV